MKAAYEHVRAELAQTGPRLEPVPAPKPVRKDDETTSMRSPAA